MNILFDALAEKEFNEAIEYYDIQMEGLGKQLKDEIRQALRILQRFPESGPVERGVIRRIKVQKFPYKILYTLLDDIILVIAIAHLHREPYYWVERYLT